MMREPSASETRRPVFTLGGGAHSGLSEECLSGLVVPCVGFLKLEYAFGAAGTPAWSRQHARLLMFHQSSEFPVVGMPSDALRKASHILCHSQRSPSNSSLLPSGSVVHEELQSWLQMSSFVYSYHSSIIRKRKRESAVPLTGGESDRHQIGFVGGVGDALRAVEQTLDMIQMCYKSLVVHVAQAVQRQDSATRRAASRIHYQDDDVSDAEAAKIAKVILAIWFPNAEDVRAATNTPRCSDECPDIVRCNAGYLMLAGGVLPAHMDILCAVHARVMTPPAIPIAHFEGISMIRGSALCRLQGDMHTNVKVRGPVHHISGQVFPQGGDIVFGDQDVFVHLGTPVPLGDVLLPLATNRPVGGGHIDCARLDGQQVGIDVRKEGNFVQLGTSAIIGLGVGPGLRTVLPSPVLPELFVAPLKGVKHDLPTTSDRLLNMVVINTEHVLLVYPQEVRLWCISEPAYAATLVIAMRDPVVLESGLHCCDVVGIDAGASAQLLRIVVDAGRQPRIWSSPVAQLPDVGGSCPSAVVLMASGADGSLYVVRSDGSLWGYVRKGSHWMDMQYAIEGEVTSGDWDMAVALQTGGHGVVVIVGGRRVCGVSLGRLSETEYKDTGFVIDCTDDDNFIRVNNTLVGQDSNSWDPPPQRPDGAGVTTCCTYPRITDPVMVEGDRGASAAGYFVAFCQVTKFMFVYHRIGAAFVASQWVGDCALPPCLGVSGPMLTSHGPHSIQVYQAPKVVPLSVDLPECESSGSACTSSTWQENCLYTENKTDTLSSTGVLCHGCEQQREFQLCLGGKNECLRIVLPKATGPMPYDVVFSEGHLKAREMGARVDVLVHPRSYMPALRQQADLARRSMRRGDVIEVWIPSLDGGAWESAKVVRTPDPRSAAELYEIEHRSASSYVTLSVPPARVRCVGEWQHDVAPAGSNQRLLQMFYLDIGEEEQARRCSTSTWEVLKKDFAEFSSQLQGCVCVSLHPGDPVQVLTGEKFPGFYIVIGGKTVAAQAPVGHVCSLPPPGVPEFCKYYPAVLAGEPRAEGTYAPPLPGSRYTRIYDYTHITELTDFWFYVPAAGVKVAVAFPLLHDVVPGHFDASPMVEHREGDQLLLRTDNGKLLPTTLSELCSADLSAVAADVGGQEVVIVRRSEVRTKVEVATAAGVCTSLWKRCCLMECGAKNLFHMANAALSVKLVEAGGKWRCYVMAHRQGTVRKGTDVYGTDSTVMQVSPACSTVMTTAYANDGSYDLSAYAEWTRHWLRVYMQGVTDPTTNREFRFADVEIEVLPEARTERDAHIAVISQVGSGARGVRGPWVQLLHEAPEAVVGDLLGATGLSRFAGLSSVPVGVQTVLTKGGDLSQTEDQMSAMVLPPELLQKTALKAATILEYAEFWFSDGVKSAIEEQMVAATMGRTKGMANKLQVLCDLLCHTGAGLNHRQTVGRNVRSGTFASEEGHLLGTARGNFKSDKDHRCFEEQYMPLVTPWPERITVPERPTRRLTPLAPV